MGDESFDGNRRLSKVIGGGRCRLQSIAIDGNRATPAAQDVAAG